MTTDGGVRAIARIVVGDPNRDARPLALLSRQSSLAEQDLRRELIALRAAAAHFALYGIFKDDTRLPALVQLFYKGIDSSFLPGVRDRGQEYAAAISVMASNDALFELPPDATTLPYTEDPAHNVGLLFAYHCQSSTNPLVVAAGTAIFAEALEQSRTLLGSS